MRLGSPTSREAFIVLANGGVYSRTLALPESATHRLPLESKARPIGSSRLPAQVVSPILVKQPGYDMEVVKFVCPITRVASIPFEKGGLNSRILLFPESPTHRSPDESKASPPGLKSPVCVVLFPPVVKLVWPRTTEALIPFEKGGLNSRILLFNRSITQRSPEESNLRLDGWYSPLLVMPFAFELKSG